MAPGPRLASPEWDPAPRRPAPAPAHSTHVGRLLNLRIFSSKPFADLLDLWLSERRLRVSIDQIILRLRIGHELGTEQLRDVMFSFIFKHIFYLLRGAHHRGIITRRPPLKW